MNKILLNKILFGIVMAAGVAAAADVDAPSPELAALKALITQQQQQIDQLRQTLEEQSVLLEKLAARGTEPPANRPAVIASLAPMLPPMVATTAVASPLPAPQAASTPTAASDPVQRAIDSINGN